MLDFETVRAARELIHEAGSRMESESQDEQLHEILVYVAGALDFATAVPSKQNSQFMRLMERIQKNTETSRKGKPKRARS